VPAVAYVRTAKTASGATAVQIVWSSRRGSRSIEHIGSAHDETELAALKTAAAARLAAGQSELDLGLTGVAGPGPLPITSSRMGYLWDTLCTAYQAVGFGSVTEGDNVFRDLVLARIIEATSKADARVLAEVGVEAASYATVKRRLPSYAQPAWRRALAGRGIRRRGRRARHRRRALAGLVREFNCRAHTSVTWSCDAEASVDCGSAEWIRRVRYEDPATSSPRRFVG
jgi:hypothetical protein